MPRDLPVPDAVVRDDNAVEMMTTWIAEGGSHAALNIGFWQEREDWDDERDAWGILLADLATHIAAAHKSAYGRDPRETIKLIQKAFERELLQPTSDLSGGFVD